MSPSRHSKDVINRRSSSKQIAVVSSSAAAATAAAAAFVGPLIDSLFVCSGTGSASSDARQHPVAHIAECRLSSSAVRLQLAPQRRPPTHMVSSSSSRCHNDGSPSFTGRTATSNWLPDPDRETPHWPVTSKSLTPSVSISWHSQIFFLFLADRCRQSGATAARVVHVNCPSNLRPSARQSSYRFQQRLIANRVPVDSVLIVVLVSNGNWETDHIHTTNHTEDWQRNWNIACDKFSRVGAQIHSHFDVKRNRSINSYKRPSSSPLRRKCSSDYSTGNDNLKTLDNRYIIMRKQTFAEYLQRILEQIIDS